MEVVRAVLNTEQPPSWERKPAESYNNSYILFDIERYQLEWNEVVPHLTFGEGSIISIQRVQNPVQWGLFKIQEEKRRQENESVNKITGFHVIHTDDLNTGMKYVLDYRRYSHRNISIQSNFKQPRFYNSFSVALEAGRSVSNTDGEVIIIKCEYYSPPKNQGDYYPVYVIRVRRGGA